MALEYTEEKLNSLDKETIIRLFLSAGAAQADRSHSPAGAGTGGRLKKASFRQVIREA